MRKFPLVQVLWTDAASNAATWTTVSDIVETIKVLSVGWAVKDTEAYLTLASSMHVEEEDGDVGNTMTIPRGMILSVKEIRVSNPRKKKVSDASNT